ncbi:MAG: endonuclease III [Treponemataceae bacterium]
MAFLTPKEIVAIFTIFRNENPSPKTELNSVNSFTLLVAVVLSAQATDKSVNKATIDLFKVAQTPKQVFDLGEEKLISYIRTIGLYRTKAKNVINLCKILIENYGEDAGANPALPFPKTREEFECLPGVGRKTASVMLNVLYDQPTMPVDTHLLRISPRIGLSDGKTPIQVEQDLLARIPQEFLGHAHHWLVLHGRYICTARNPQCATCCIAKICKKNFEKEKGEC